QRQRWCRRRRRRVAVPAPRHPRGNAEHGESGDGQDHVHEDVVAPAGLSSRRQDVTRRWLRYFLRRIHHARRRHATVLPHARTYIRSPLHPGLHPGPHPGLHPGRTTRADVGGGVAGSRAGSKKEREELLQKVSMFSALNKKEVGRLAAVAEERRVPSGTVLTEEGQPGDEFFVVAEGMAEATIRGRKVGTIPAGSFFG